MRLFTALLAVLATSVTASGQSPAPTGPPLPARERIQTSPPLSVSLRLSANRVAIGTAPTFTVVIGNTGREVLLLNPSAVSNIQIFSPSGQMIPPASGGIAEYAGGPLKRSAFIPLAPGQTREFVVAPEYHSLTDYSGVGLYLAGWSDAERRRMMLPAGDYVVRLTYIAVPDYAPSGYNAYDVPDVWEGRVDAPPVPLTVLPPPDADVRDAIAQLERGDRPLPAIELVRMGRVAGAVDPLLRLFPRAADLRLPIAEAVVAIDAGRGGLPLLEAMAALPQDQRDSLMSSRVFIDAVRGTPGCASVPYVAAATESGRADVAAMFGDALGELSRRCPDLRVRLTTLLRTPVPVPATYMGSDAAYARRRAAEVLGRIGNADDVALLVAVLKREIPGLPPPTNWYGDPAREGAARALGRIGGAAAAAALLEQLNDRAGNRHIMPVIVEETGRLNPAGTVEALVRLLDATDQTILVRVLITLRQLRAVSAVPALLTVLRHPDATVRNYASSVLLDLGPAVPAPAMLAAIDDPDPYVRANVMFYLARHGAATSLPRFVQGVTSNVQFVREASVEGIARFGTSDTFAPLRAALDTAPESVVHYVEQALDMLTFGAVGWPQPRTAWDAWWKTHAARSRLQWAEEALDAVANGRNGGSNFLAARYVAALSSPPDVLMERLLSDRNWFVRDVAIERIRTTDPRRATALLLRELDSRYLGACNNAVRKLAMPGETQSFDCTRPADRDRARAHWAPLASP